MKLAKRHYVALEKVFAAEIGGHLFQSKAKIYADLEAGGYLLTTKETLHFKDGLGPMTFTGYALTHPGRIAYCEYASRVFEEELT